MPLAIEVRGLNSKSTGVSEFEACEQADTTERELFITSSDKTEDDEEDDYDSGRESSQESVRRGFKYRRQRQLYECEQDSVASGLISKLIKTISFNSSSRQTQQTNQTQSNLTHFRNSWLQDGDQREEYNSIDHRNSQMIDSDFVFKRTLNLAPEDFHRDGNPTWPQSYRLSNRRRRTIARCAQLSKILLCLVILLLSIFFTYKLTNLVLEQRQNLQHQFGTENDETHLFGSKSQWLVSGPKCHIPSIDAWHESVKKYAHISEPLNCTKLSEELNEKNRTFPIRAKSFVQDNRLFFTAEAIGEGFLEHDQCCFRAIRRSEGNDDDLEEDETCYKIRANDLLIPFEIVQVECRVKVGKVSAKQQMRQKETASTSHARKRSSKTDDEVRFIEYKNVHAFIVPKPEELAVLARAAMKNLNSNKYYNILMLGMDTISRLNADRQLQRSMKVLRDQFKTIEFKGYNKVGENTFPNLIPLLTGLKPSQLVETKCWLSSNYTDENERGDEYLDDCKYLWNYYQEFGYMTYFSEDWPVASTFNYLKPGFKLEPTAYYGRPITLARTRLENSSKGLKCDICLFDRPSIELDLNHLKAYLRAYTNHPYFAFKWINCPQHDDLNGASRVDEIVEKFLIDILNITQQQRTFVIFFSDHGWRWNGFVSTRVGHYESSLPLLTIAPPRAFIEEHPDLYKRLFGFESSLLTPFDLFKTLVDIRNLAKRVPANQFFAPFAEQFANLFTLTPPMPPVTAPFAFGPTDRRPIKRTTSNSTVSQPPSTGPTGAAAASATKARDSASSTAASSAATTITQISPQDGYNFKQDFRVLSLISPDNNSTDRSCIEAGIPDNYCVCHEFKDVDKNSLDVLGAAYYLVYVHLHKRVLDGEKICAPLNFKQLEGAQRHDFKNSDSSRRRRSSNFERAALNGTLSGGKLANITTTKSVGLVTKSTTSEPRSHGDSSDEDYVDEQHYLPNREYNIKVITEPGQGSFQEVLRFYGEDVSACEQEVSRVKELIESADSISMAEKHKSVLEMNRKCKFSIHSESISRLNLYKEQSKCVKSNIELKKVCYCKDLLTKPSNKSDHVN